MKKQMIIVAGGKGIRMGSDIPKQFIIVAGKPLLMHTIEKIHAWDCTIKLILVLPQDNIERWFLLCKEYNFLIHHIVVEGGATRWESVKNGLAFAENEGVIGIHDGVRPIISPTLLKKCFSTAENLGNAIPYLKITDSLRELHGETSKACNRNNFITIQTPQVFHANILKKVYELPSHNFTDDASAIEWYGYNINLVEGSDDNIKITTPKDLIYAEHLLRS